MNRIIKQFLRPFLLNFIVTYAATEYRGKWLHHLYMLACHSIKYLDRYHDKQEEVISPISSYNRNYKPS
jgi:hypothetical protein